MLSSFTKIHTLGTKYTKDIFQSPVEITEKLDGSQIGWGRINGEVIIRSKNTIINLNAIDNLFVEGVNQIQRFAHLIPEGMMFYGEYFKKPKHNTLAYDRIPKNHIALFAAGFAPDMFFSEYSDLQRWAYLFDIETIPLLYHGKASTENIEKLLDTTSVLSGAKIEGVVVKNYNLSCVLTPNVILPITCGKYVSEAFKEVHRGSWKDRETSGGKLNQLFQEFRTTARWMKAVQHLREQGVLQDSPKDIGPLFKEVHQDIEAEEIEYIKEKLYDLYRKDLLKVSTNGFPEWYKQQLLLKCGDS